MLVSSGAAWDGKCNLIADHEDIKWCFQKDNMKAMWVRPGSEIREWDHSDHRIVCGVGAERDDADECGARLHDDVNVVDDRHRCRPSVRDHLAANKDARRLEDQLRVVARRRQEVAGDARETEYRQQRPFVELASEIQDAGASVASTGSKRSRPSRRSERPLAATRPRCAPSPQCGTPTRDTARRRPRRRATDPSA